eukprot:Lankesteria_metandrocarpae@DN6087_c0_g1_i1.p1
MRSPTRGGSSSGAPKFLSSASKSSANVLANDTPTGGSRLFTSATEPYDGATSPTRTRSNSITLTPISSKKSLPVRSGSPGTYVGTPCSTCRWSPSPLRKALPLPNRVNRDATAEPINIFVGTWNVQHCEFNHEEVLLVVPNRTDHIPVIPVLPYNAISIGHYVSGGGKQDKRFDSPASTTSGGDKSVGTSKRTISAMKLLSRPAASAGNSMRVASSERHSRSTTAPPQSRSYRPASVEARGSNEVVALGKSSSTRSSRMDGSSPLPPTVPEVCNGKGVDHYSQVEMYGDSGYGGECYSTSCSSDVDGAGDDNPVDIRYSRSSSEEAVNDVTVGTNEAVQLNGTRRRLLIDHSTYHSPCNSTGNRGKQKETQPESTVTGISDDRYQVSVQFEPIYRSDVKLDHGTGSEVKELAAFERQSSHKLVKNVESSTVEPLAAWLKPGYHIYVVCLQEACSSKFYHFIEAYLNRAHSERFHRIKFSAANIKGFGDGAHLSRKCTSIACFVRHDKLSPFGPVSLSSANGLSLSMLNGSKGAICCILKIFEQVVCFIGCHLPATTPRSRLKAREYIRKKLVEECCSTPDATLGELFHHMVWTGDFNSRTCGLGANDVVTLLEQGRSSAILEHDEWNFDKNSLDLRFDNLEELPIKFDPTYKKLQGRYPANKEQAGWPSLQYKTAFKEQWYKGGRVRERVPSYTDRVLKRSQPCLRSCLSFVEDSYGPPICSADSFLMESDHDPVGCGLQIYPLHPKFDLPPVKLIEDENKLGVVKPPKIV